VVVGIRHKGLKQFYKKGSTRGIRHDHEKKSRRILAALDAATRPADLNLPGYDLHPLKGNRAGTWSISVSGNWRVTFEFDGNDVTAVDYEDDH
jgi:toxin HigB-1